MEKLELSIEIDSTREKVWKVLLDDETYRIWTSAFHPGSYAVSDWKEGSKVHFKTPEGDGMVSYVAKHKPGEVISFKHVGLLSNGQEIFEGTDIDEWTGAMETYYLENANDKLLFKVEQDIDQKHHNMFKEIWLKALAKLKDLAENA